MESYLRTDGMVVLKLIRLNMGVNTTTEIIVDIFAKFKKLNEEFVFSDSTSVSNYSTLGGGGGGGGVHNRNLPNPHYSSLPLNDSPSLKHPFIASHNNNNVQSNSPYLSAPTAPHTASRTPSRAPSTCSVDLVGGRMASPVQMQQQQQQQQPENVPLRYQEKEGSTV